MKTLCGFEILLLSASALPAQNRSGFVNPGGIIRRSVPSVVLPAGTSALPGVQRTTPNVVYPAGGLAIGIPGTPNVRANLGLRPNAGFGRQDFGRGDRRVTGFNGGAGGIGGGGGVTAIPMIVGGYGGYGAYAGYPEAPYADPGAPDTGAGAPQQPNVTVIYPPQHQSSVVVYGSSGSPQYAGPQYPGPQHPGPQTRIFEPPPAQQAVQAEPESEPYLLAFKDRSVYAALTYWVDGDTLHYFTSRNIHNQASLSLVDRDLTLKLNSGTAHEVKLPVAR